MTPRLRFRKRARDEVLAARDWYDARFPGLGLEFARTVDATLALVQRMPEAFKPLRGDIRQVVMRRFPTQFSSPMKRKRSWCSQFTTTEGHRLAGTGRLTPDQCLKPASATK